MFILTTMRDGLLLEPAQLTMPFVDLLARSLEARYINKVVQEVGLGIAVYDILKTVGGEILLYDGAASFDVTFRLVAFRPLIGEVILGTIQSSDE